MDRSLIPRRALTMALCFLLVGTGGAGCRLERDPATGAAGSNGHQEPAGAAAETGSPDAGQPAQSEDPSLVETRHRMVADQIEWRGVKDPAVLKAMRTVPRHRFVPEHLLIFAYDDGPLPIGEGQTISQPYIVALMTEMLQLPPGAKVLEVGTGSGYQAAVLAEMGAEVYTIEIVEPLARSARARLEAMGYGRIHFRTGDGYRGWPEAAPFDCVIVTAAPDHIPQPLVDQLKIGGRLVIPVGAAYQELVAISKTEKGTRREASIPVRFVPMTGEAMDQPY